MAGIKSQPHNLQPAPDDVDGSSEAESSGIKHGPAQRRRFAREDILSAIDRWVLLYGAPPTGTDWEPSRARRTGQAQVAARWESGTWPSTRMVRTAFGSFNHAIESAGFTPAPATRHVARLAGPDFILKALHKWTALYGQPPTQADWDPARARRLRQQWRVRRYSSGDWPSFRSVCIHFGNLNAAIGAAGLTPRPPGTRRGRETSNAAASQLIAEQACDGRVSPALLAARISAVVQAHRAEDSMVLRGSLIQLAATALSWADRLPVSER